MRNHPRAARVVRAMRIAALRTWRSLVAATALLALAGGAAVWSGCALETRGPALAERAKAPDFTLRSHQGARVALSELLRRGPAVIVFYRGHW